MTRAEAQDTLEDRLEQAYSTVTFFLTAENSNSLTPRIMSGALWTLQELIVQARQAYREICADTPPERVEVDIHDTAESVLVIRETADELRGALVTLDTFLAERT